MTDEDRRDLESITQGNKTDALAVMERLGGDRLEQLGIESQLDPRTAQMEARDYLRKEPRR